ncbi:MAG: sulfatase-like hydrolase/transferase, partial [Verrucomicrobia bacterium]|nr:sulfatase-like hydrolase/transferase [Verrucomicrobiota bacterium]
HSPARHHIHGHFADHAQNAARFMPDWLDTNAVTVTRLLQQAGYATGHFGKWHLGGGEGAPTPAAYGIDDVRALVCREPAWNEPAGTFWAKSTAAIVDETLRFLRANRDRPFYANTWTLLPHAPLNPTPEQLAVYADLDPRADDPAFGSWMRDYLRGAKDLRSQMRIFCASLTDLDTQIGRLLKGLDDLGLAENTVVFFSSDNGPEDYRIGNATNAGVGSTGPLRARKRSMYEGGIRTFGLVRWPGHVAAGRVDGTSVVGGVDWLPTVCKLAGVTVPAAVKPDGEDVSDIWLGASRPRTRPLHWEWLFRVWGDEYAPPMLAVRDGAWKLFVRHDGSGVELYDIPKDPAESRNVAPDHPEIVKDLSSKALAWAASLPETEARRRVAADGAPLDRVRAPAVPSAKVRAERAAMFKQKDTNGDGTMSLEEYLHKFPDETEGRRRFPTFDSNKDGVLSEEEFVTMGRSAR